MLLPQSERMEVDTQPNTSARLTSSMDQSLTEDYGDIESDKRTLGGGVDFFSSLGTERKKKPRENKPDPEKVRNLLIYLA